MVINTSKQTNLLSGRENKEADEKRPYSLSLKSTLSFFEPVNKLEIELLEQKTIGGDMPCFSSRW